MPVWHKRPVPVTYRIQDGSHAIEPLGNIFRNEPGGMLVPAYMAGPKESKNRLPMLTCPVFVIPAEIFELLQLFHECRLFKLPPKAGGLFDQPWQVRRAFPIFAIEMGKVERQQEYQIAEHAAAAGGAAASVTVLKAMFGKG